MLSIRRLSEGGVYTLSVLLTGLVIGNAFHQKKQFYPAVVYLTKSSPSLAVLAVQAFIFVVLLGKLTRKIFFGSLRAAEMEHLIERSWYAVTETCLAFTVFREDFNAMFVAMFTMLLFFKCFHWLAEDRVDYMERSPLLGCVFHSRILGLLGSLAFVDCFFMKQAYLTTIVKGASAQLVFGFEYAILLTIVFTVLVKYMLHCIDLYDENPWDNKAVYLLYLELLTSGWKFLLYVVFVTIMSKVHTLPLFAIRPLDLTRRSFKKALTDVILSRRAIRNMNQLYPNATAEDLQSVDDCIICREPMQAQGGCKKLPCSHIFHASCLRSWFQRQQTCPTCRMEVLSTVPAAPAAAAAPAPPNVAPAAGQAPPMANPWMAFQAAAQAPPAAAQPAAPVPGQVPVPPFNPTPFPAAQPNVPNGAAMPPPMPPFLNFMAMPPPPPMPQANLSSLTEDQLRQMETDERAALEARIQWLRDIQTLLDTAVEQMHQYTLVMSALNASRVPAANQNTSTPANQNTSAPTNQGTAPSQSADVPSGIPITPTAAGEQSSADTSHPVQPSTQHSPTLGGATVGTSHTPLTSLGGARPKTISTELVQDRTTQGVELSPEETTPTPSSPTAEEVRKRRLARFEQNGGDV